MRAQVAGAPKREPPSGPLDPQSCTKECHQPIGTRPVRHSQTAADCSACHLQIGDASGHKFSFPAPKEELCAKCHKLQLENSVHAPVKDGKCMDCHDPHGSDHKAELRGDPNRDLCSKCHNDDKFKKPFVHGPVAVGACVACHKPHSSSEPKLLVAETNTLCKTCHEDVAKAAPDAHLHKALEQGCINCHDPHASDHKFQLKETAPKLCMTCHQAMFDQLTSGNAVVHGAITDEGGCTTCHEPHSSKLPALARAVQPDSCLKCHDKQLKTPDGKNLVNMAALLKNNPEKHGPIRDGHCTACHNPHAGKKFRLLSQEYPDKFYSPFSMDLYKLCFECHSSELVLKRNGAGITQFRNGNKNLHAVHVNQDKGRTCRACHEVHASKRAAHIRESVPFGSSTWMLEINFQKSEEGGSCSPGCHTVRRYSRVGPLGVPNILTPANDGSQGGTPPSQAAPEPKAPADQTPKGAEDPR